MTRIWQLGIWTVLAAGAVWGQGISTIKIGTLVNGPYFYVDGKQYSSTQVFAWPTGSKHIVQFLISVDPNGNPLGYQNGNQDLLRYFFSGWQTTGLALPLGANPEQVITAGPELTQLIANVTVQHRVQVRFFANAPGNGDCANALSNPTLDGRRYGIVFIDSTCFGDTNDIFLSEGPHQLTAYPLPGYVFTGFSFNGTTTNSANTQFNVVSAVSIVPQFMPAKRVRFTSEPQGLDIVVDSALVNLPPPLPTQYILPGSNISDTCNPNYTKLPVGTPLGIPVMCIGDFDFLPGSSHRLGAPESQRDSAGLWWVFRGFSNGLGQNGIYTVDQNVGQSDAITAKFVPGVPATFLTSPQGLKLEVDGKTNLLGYTFMWGAGDKHSVTAPATQVDARGRRYRFTGWSNGKDRTQEVTVPEDRYGFTLTANYQILGQVQVISEPAGLSVSVDGSTCSTPCTVDKDAGQAISIVTPERVSKSNMSRLDFDGWAGGVSAASRSVTFTTDVQTVKALYHNSHLLVANSDPVGQVNFTFTPTSADNFYAEGTQVQVQVAPKGGFKFRRWDGDLAGTFSTGFLTMATPREVIARLDKVPFIPESGVKNAAGETPDGTVAPGSIIAIYGENIAPSLVIGPTNPLAQTLGGVTVTIQDRLLPLLFVSPQQINAQVPSDLADGKYTLKVQSVGQPDVPGVVQIKRNAPGLFTQQTGDGSQIALAFHEDGKPVTADSPAKRKEIVTLYGTGFGPYDRRVIDGFIVPTDAIYKLMDGVIVLTAELQLTPQFAGAAPGMVGTAIMRLRISDEMPTGTNLEMQVQVNGALSNKVLLPVE